MELRAAQVDVDSVEMSDTQVVMEDVSRLVAERFNSPPPSGNPRFLYWGPFKETDFSFEQFTMC